MLDVQILNHSKHKVPRAFLETWIAKLERELHRGRWRMQYSSKEPRPATISKSQKAASLTLVFLDAPAAKELNKKFRGKNYATDVLSFAPTEPGSLGELVICPEVIVRQAREHNLSQKDEYGYMVLHGVLHLLGFDHERSSAEELRMFELQDGIFASLCRKLRALPRKF